MLLRRVKERMRRLTSELNAGKTPVDSSLRELRQDIEELAPALGALQRHVAARVSHQLDTVTVERRLRWVLRRTAVLIAALARSGVDTAELLRLLSCLRGSLQRPRPGRLLAALARATLVPPRPTRSLRIRALQQRRPSPGAES